MGKAQARTDKLFAFSANLVVDVSYPLCIMDLSTERRDDMTKQVIFKAKMGALWIKAEVVRKVEGGYILNCGETKGFFVETENVKEVAA